MNPMGGTTSTRTPLLIAFWPSLEVAAAELRHMAQPWLNAGVAHKKNDKTRSAARAVISLPDRECEKHPERKRWSSGSDKRPPNTLYATSCSIPRTLGA